MQTNNQYKPTSVLDKLFYLLHLINQSDDKLSVVEVSEISGIHQRTVLRYLTRLVQERMIDFGVRMSTVNYDYNIKSGCKGDKVLEVARASQSYEYYRLGFDK